MVPEIFHDPDNATHGVLSEYRVIGSIAGAAMCFLLLDLRSTLRVSPSLATATNGGRRRQFTFERAEAASRCIFGMRIPSFALVYARSSIRLVSIDRP